MKRLILLIFTLATISCLAQSNDQYVPPPQQQRRPQSMQQPRWMNNTPGYEIQKAGRYHFEGLTMEAGSIVLFIISSAEQQAANNTNSNNNSAGAGAAFAGTLLFITGGVYQVLGWVHLTRAGKLMDLHHISMGPTQNGVGLTYKF